MTQIRKSNERKALTAEIRVRIEDGDDWVRIYEDGELVHDDHPFGRSLDVARQYERSGAAVELWFGTFGGEYGDLFEPDELVFVGKYQEEL